MKRILILTSGREGEKKRQSENTFIYINIYTIKIMLNLGDRYYERLPVVLIHGMVVASTYLTPLFEQLAPWFQVFAPDLPGIRMQDKRK